MSAFVDSDGARTPRHEIAPDSDVAQYPVKAKNRHAVSKAARPAPRAYASQSTVPFRAVTP